MAMGWGEQLALFRTQRAGRLPRWAWLAFTVLAVSLGVLGIPAYYDLLRTPCSAPPCFGAQLSPRAAQAWSAYGQGLVYYAGAQLVVTLTLGALLVSTAGFLIWRTARNTAATLAAFVGTALATGTLSQALALTDPRFRLPVQLIMFVQLAGLLPLALLFPDGHVRPRWLRWIAAASVVASGVYVALRGQGRLAPGSTGSVGWLVVAMSAALIGSASLVYRARHTQMSLQQEQLRWVAVGLGLALPVVLLDAQAPWLGLALRDRLVAISPELTLIVSLLLTVGSFTCLLVALVHYEPLTTDVLLNRTFVYAVLTVFVVGMYGLVVGYLSIVFRSDNVLFSLIATGLVAVVFQPVRAWLQRAVNRLMYGVRVEPYAVMSHLGVQLQATLAPDAVLPTIVAAVSAALNLPYVAMILVSESVGGEVTVRIGEPTPQTLRLPLVYGGATLGYLIVSPRTGEADLSRTDRHLLADLATQAGPVVHGVRLMADLQRLTVELQRSREQLVLAREEDRRRLRRDLHDELAPSLAGLSLTAGTIKSVAQRDPAAVMELATELHAALRRAVGDIRRLVYDLRPPALDDLGLVAAIEGRAAQFNTPYGAAPASQPPLHVAVEVPAPLPPLPAALEVAAYRIVQEALMNAVRHAHAAQCRIRLVVDESAGGAACLELQIHDDGVGIGDVQRAGVGLRSMRERAEELGGTCDVRRGAQGGTRVVVRLPMATGEQHAHSTYLDR